MHRNPQRPLSPHLSAYRWGPHMVVSALSRITGSGLATVGAIALVWWLAAAAGGPESYAYFTAWACSWPGIVIGAGLSWAFFLHMLAGLRHLVMDIGAGYELSTNKFWANMTLVGSAVLTALFWIYIVMVK